MLVNLILMIKKIILDGIKEKTNRLSFSQNKDSYNKLPLGDSAIILA